MFVVNTVEFMGKNIYRTTCHTAFCDKYVFFFGANSMLIADMVGRRICSQLGFTYSDTRSMGKTKRRSK